MGDSELTKEKLLEQVRILRSQVERLRAEHQHAEQMLQYEQRYRAVVENTQDIIYSVTPDGTLTFVSPQVSKLGYSAEDVVGHNLSEFIHPDDIEHVMRDLAKTVETGREFPTEFRLSSRDAGWVYVEEAGSAICEGGRVVQIVGSIRDITEHKQIEQGLAWERNLLRCVIDSLPDRIYVKDTKSRFVICNRAVAAEAGLENPEDLVGKSDFDRYPKERARGYYEQEQQIIRTGRAVINEEKPGVNGTLDVAWASNTKVPWRDDNGKIIGIIGSNRDVSERKKAEEALDKERRMLRTLIDNIPDQIYIKDKESKFVLCNKAVAEFHGMANPEEMVGKTDFDLYPPDTAQQCKEEERQVLRTGKPVVNQEESGTDKDGNWVCGLTTKVPLVDSEGEIIGIVGVGRRITERKKAEEALDKERRMLRTLIDNIPDQIYVKDTESRFVLCNKAIAKFHGMANPKDMVGKTDFDLYPPDMAQRYDEEERQMLRTSKPVVNREDSDTDKEGNLVCGLTTKFPLVGSEGEIIGIVGVSRMITERKKAEQALRESEERYKEMFHAAAEGILVTDVESKKFRYANPAICEMLGYTEEELTSMGVPDIHPKEDLDYVMSEFEAQVRKGKTLAANIPCLRRDGTVIYADINATNVTIDGKSRNVGFFTDTTERKLAEEALRRAHDELEARVERRTADLAAAVEELRNEIAERKRAEKALRKAEERFRTIFENTAVGLYRTTPDGRILLANPALVKMLGYESFEELAKMNLEEHGIDVSTPRSAFKRRVEKQGRVIGLESVWIRRNGTKLFICESAVTIRDEKGNVLYYEGTVEDITERKKVEDKLLVYQEQLRSLASELSLAEERLRRRIATDLHDNVSQNLAISKIKLDSLVESAASKDIQALLEEIRDLVAQTIESTRSLTFEMSPPVLYELGFEAAMGWLARQTRQRHGLTVDFEDDGRDKPLDNNTRVLLFQAVRELLVNVVKHAKAGQVKVSARKFRGRIRVTVEDDGVGFDASKISADEQAVGGFGLFNIRERLDHIGGQVKIDSRPGGGTRITLTAPLDTQSKPKTGERK